MRICIFYLKFQLSVLFFCLIITFRTSLPAFGCAGHEGGWEPLWANWKLTDLEQKVEWEADLSPFYSDKFLLRSHGEQRVSQLDMREYPRGGGLEISPDHQYHNWLEIHPGMGPRAAGLQPPLGMGFSAGKRKEDQIQQALVVNSHGRFWCQKDGRLGMERLEEVSAGANPRKGTY